jgi:hypothetical protein
MRDYKDLKNKIEYILREYPETRNSDVSLTCMLWWHYYRSYLIKSGEEYLLNLKYLKRVPSQDAIRRIRAKIQNEERKFLPTNLEVAKQRHWQEEEWRKALGYNPELRTI